MPLRGRHLLSRPDASRPSASIPHGPKVSAVVAIFFSLRRSPPSRLRGISTPTSAYRRVTSRVRAGLLVHCLTADRPQPLLLRASLVDEHLARAFRPSSRYRETEYQRGSRRRLKDKKCLIKQKSLSDGGDGGCVLDNFMRSHKAARRSSMFWDGRTPMYRTNSKCPFASDVPTSACGNFSHPPAPARRICMGRRPSLPPTTETDIICLSAVWGTAWRRTDLSGTGDGWPRVSKP